MLSQCPETFRSSLVSTNAPFHRSQDDFVEAAEGGEAARDLSESFLVKLHRRVIVSVQVCNATMCQWNKTIEQAIYLEDVCRNQASANRLFESSTGAGFVWHSFKFPEFG